MWKWKLSLSALTLAVTLLTSTTARADVLIDDFITPNPAVTYSLSAAVPDTFTRNDVLASGISRSISVTQTANSLGLPGQTSGAVGTTGLGGVFALGTNPGTTAFAHITYTTAPLNLSVGGTDLVFTFLSTDLNIPFSVRVGDGTNTSTQTGTVNSPTTFNFPLSGFSGVNLAAVTTIEFFLNQNVLTADSTQSADFTIRDVRVTTPQGPSVPAPPAAFLALAALPALGAWRMVKARKTVAA